MELVLQVLMIVALLFCESRQVLGVGNRGNTRPKAARARNGYNQGSGPYDIEVQLIHLCDDAEYNNTVNLTVEAYNTKTNGVSKIMYRGNFSSHFTAEEIQKLEVKINIYRVKDGKDFRLVNYDENMCKTCEGPAKDVLIDIRRVLGLGGDKCDFPTGDYSFKDWEVDITLPPPILEYGTYRATVQLLHEGKTFACVKGHGLVKQKF